MPHVELKCFPGKTEEQKKECAEKIAEAVASVFGCKESSVSVSVRDVEKEDWKDEVWDKAIVNDTEHLYKKPGYEWS